MDEIDEEKTSSKDDSEILPGEHAMIDVKKQRKECKKRKRKKDGWMWVLQMCKWNRRMWKTKDF